jgi:hypothetical protein
MRIGVPNIGLVVLVSLRTVLRMYGCAWFLLAVLLGWSSSADAQSKARGQLEIQRSSDVCSALDEAECCAQMLAIAVFRATGDQVPKKAKGPVRLSCQDPNRTIPENACRLIAMGRGLNAQDAADVCSPAGLVKRCSSDAPCRQCMEDLDRLEWKGAARACYALTYLPKVTPGTRVVRLDRRK